MIRCLKLNSWAMQISRVTIPRVDVRVRVCMRARARARLCVCVACVTVCACVRACVRT